MLVGALAHGTNNGLVATPRAWADPNWFPRSRRDRQASHCDGRKLRERRIPLLQVLREQQGVAVGLDHAAAHQEPHQPASVIPWPQISAHVPRDVARGG
jgi:hypothetical protein